MLSKQILVTIFYLVVFNLCFIRFKKLQLKGYKPIITNLLFNLKFVTGIFIWCIYTFYYTDVQNNDVHKFYTDALVLRQTANENYTAFLKLMTGNSEDASTQVYTDRMKNWERNFDEAPVNENRTIIRLNALLMFFSLRTYFVHILAMCFLSLIGWVLAVNAIFNYAGKNPRILTLFVLMLPSVLFWTSGVMKEPVLVLGLGLFLHGLLNLQFTSNRYLTKSLLALAAGAIVLLSIKFYVLICLLPAALAFLIFRKAQKTSIILAKYAAVNVLLLALAFSMQNFVSKINLPQMLVNKQVHSVKEAEYFKAGSRIAIPEITPDAFSIIKTAPIGIWNTIVRPYLWESRNPLMLASALENILVVLIIICVLYRSRRSIIPLNLVLFLLAFSLSYFALIGICTPVLGNLVRYRAPILPLFLAAAILLANDHSPENVPFWGRIYSWIA